MSCTGRGDEPSIKVLFLDVDGVLNNLQSLSHNRFALDDDKILLLKDILLYTGAKIVVSSTWRLHADAMGVLKTKLDSVGIDPGTIVGSTRNLEFAKRSDEIIEWLGRNSRVISWAAVDDMNLSVISPMRFQNHFVLTKTEEGLTNDRCQILKSILGKAKTADGGQEKITQPESNSLAGLAAGKPLLQSPTALVTRKRTNSFSLITAESYKSPTAPTGRKRSCSFSAQSNSKRSLKRYTMLAHC